MKHVITLLALATLSAVPSMAQAGEYGRYATTTEQFEAGFPRMIDGRYPLSSPPKERIPVGAYIPPVENSFVVNIGDSMRMWTNNRFASTLHRVVNHYGRERYSVGVFANPDYDTVIRPLPTCVDTEHPPTFDQMLSGEAMLFLYSRVWPSKGEPDKVSGY